MEIRICTQSSNFAMFLFFLLFLQLTVYFCDLAFTTA